MDLELRRAGTVDGPVDPTPYVRRSPVVVAAYDATLSVVLGAVLGLLVGTLAASGAWQRPGEPPPPASDAWGYAAYVFVAATVVALLAQLVAGPFVLTRDVVCRACHARQHIRRIPFLAGRYTRPPRCACGGKYEPARLWRQA